MIGRLVPGMLLLSMLLLSMLLPSMLLAKQPALGEVAVVKHSRKASSASHRLKDLLWVCDFAERGGSSGGVRESELNHDPRFAAMLRDALPQRQYFWQDHGALTPLADLVHTFIGVPGQVLLTGGRYVTVDGCVPHACSARGLVWIDTGGEAGSDCSKASSNASRPGLIFVATDDVNGAPASGESLVQLWMFSSGKLNWQELPASFLQAVRTWWAATSKVWAKYTPERVVIVSLVEPSGRVTTLSPEFFHLNGEE